MSKTEDLKKGPFCVARCLPKILKRSPAEPLADFSEGRSLGIRKAHTGGKVGSEDAILGCEVFILEQEFLIDQPGDVRQQPSPFVVWPSLTALPHFLK